MLRQGGGGGLVVCGVWEGSTKMSAVSYAWGKIHQVLVWGKCQSTCLILFGPQTCSRPLYSPKGISCQQLLLFIFFFFSFQFSDSPTHCPFIPDVGKTHDLLSRLFAFSSYIRCSGCHDKKLGCHASISPWSCLMRATTSWPYWFLISWKRLSAVGSEGE